MLTHTDVWQAIDSLAASHGCSVSALARRAGLDPTTFNKSKRISPQGKPRWPSTESLSKILEATGDSLSDFVRLTGQRQSSHGGRRVMVSGLAQAGSAARLDGHRPRRMARKAVLLPDLDDPSVFALEISGDSMTPVYRDGDVIVLSPSAPIRRGDRVVVKTHGGEIIAKQLVMQTSRRVRLQPLNPASPGRELRRNEIAWMARVIWSSQ